MPIYEFYCKGCHTIFNFLSRRINTEKIPSCPKCKKRLRKQMSSFATIGRAREGGDDLPAGLDEKKIERVLGDMMQDAGNINEDDPRQMAGFMRKFSDRSGMDLGDGMQEALARLESGEDPESIEAEMGDVFDSDDPMSFLKKKTRPGQKRAPDRDETLYEM